MTARVRTVKRREGGGRRKIRRRWIREKGREGTGQNQRRKIEDTREETDPAVIGGQRKEAREETVPRKMNEKAAGRRPRISLSRRKETVPMIVANAENMTETEVWKRARGEIEEKSMTVTDPPLLQDTEDQDLDPKGDAETDPCLPETIGGEDVEFYKQVDYSAVNYYDNVNVLYKIHSNNKSGSVIRTQTAQSEHHLGLENLILWTFPLSFKMNSLKSLLCSSAIEKSRNVILDRVIVSIHNVPYECFCR